MRAAGRVTAVVLFISALSAWGAGYVLDSPPLATPWDVTWAMSFLAFPTVGLLLAVRRSRNPIGWMFIVGPGAIGAGVALDESGRILAGENVFAVGLLTLLSSLLLFPDGRYPGRLWRWLHVSILAAVVLEPIVYPATDGGLAVGGAFFLTVASLAYRAVRGEGDSRNQILLPVAVGLTGAVGVTVSGLLVEADWVGVLWMSVMTVGIPAAIGVAILRHRLFDLDRIVSRTVSYALVALVVAVVFAVPVIALPSFLGESNDMVIAGSTLAAAAVFSPARRRIQAVVDRRFNRARYDAAREVEEFAARLAGEIDLAAVTGDLDDVIRRTLAPSSVAVWLRVLP